MFIFKLFYTQTNIPKLNTRCIRGRLPQVFGVGVEPETYREFMNESYSLFRREHVEQHIMTNFKFMEFIKSRKMLGVEVADIIIKDQDQLYLLSNENYIYFRKELNKGNLDGAFEFLKALIDEGSHISKIECFIKYKDETKERINIQDNGTISFSEPVDLIEDYIKNSSILDYLVLGPEVLN